MIPGEIVQHAMYYDGTASHIVVLRQFPRYLEWYERERTHPAVERPTGVRIAYVEDHKELCIEAAAVLAAEAWPTIEFFEREP